MDHHHRIKTIEKDSSHENMVLKFDMNTKTDDLVTYSEMAD